MHKMLVRIANRQDLMIRLLLKKQSALGMHCLSRSFWQATAVRSFRIFTAITFLLIIVKPGSPVAQW